MQVGDGRVGSVAVIAPSTSCEATVLLCHCRVVSDRAVRAAASAGAADVEQVAALCGAGAECGGCHPSIEALLAEAAVAVRAPEGMAERQREARRRGVAAFSPAH